MHRFAFIILILTACGNGDWVGKDGYTYTTEDFVLGNTFVVHPKGQRVSPEQVEGAMQVVWDMLTEKRGSTVMDTTKMQFEWNKTPGQYRITYIPDIFPCSLKAQADHGLTPQEGDQICYGVYHAPVDIQVQWHDCIGEVSLNHELIHFFMHHMTTVGDGDHSDGDLWKNPNSVETKSSDKLKELYCEQE